MIDDTCRIYVEQLRDGHSEKLNETLAPDFLEVHEADLSFVDPVIVSGEAYLADNELILRMDISTKATMPCRICNELIKVDIQIPGLYSAVPMDEIKSAVYDFRGLLREVIILEVPNLVECNQGQCPTRDEVKKFFKNEKDDQSDEDGYRPFADLE